MISQTSLIVKLCEFIQVHLEENSILLLDHKITDIKSWIPTELKVVSETCNMLTARMVVWLYLKETLHRTDVLSRLQEWTKVYGNSQDLQRSLTHRRLHAMAYLQEKL